MLQELESKHSAHGTSNLGIDMPMSISLFKTLFEHAADGLVVMNAQRQVVYMNEAAVRLTGCDPEASQGAHCGTLFRCHDDDQRSLGIEGCHGLCVLTTHKPLVDVEMNIVSQSGDVVPVAVTYSHIPGQDGPYLLMSIRDISDRKRLERERRQREAMEFTLRERERLARDLHDGVVQDIAYANMQMKVMLEDAERGHPPSAADIARVSQVLDTSLVSLRQAIYDLTFRVDDNLIEALRKTAIEFESRTGLTTRFTSNISSLQVDGYFGGHVVKVVQEALHNVWKHANAHEVTIRCDVRASRKSGEPSWLHVCVEDDGVGFAQENLSAEGHMGLRTMRDRCHLMGGMFEVRSEPGHGTQVRFLVPLT